ncbi:hypothetical protein KJ359_002158 [Pestalotiopsis sp. 9143b]|nr:hypothetical protein KJ359_002158 [Pestalotiopsis sp. 9143b]
MALTTKAAVDYHPSDISSASSNDLNNAGKIAVGICSTLAALALVFTIWCIRRRKRSAKGYIQTPPMTRAFKAHYQEPSESHASLISMPAAPPPPPLPPPPPAAAFPTARPSQSLTPPMRLSDRRFLPSTSSPTSARSFSAPPYSSQPDLAMPEQPAYTSRTSPPHEKCETMSSIESNYTDAHNYDHGTDAAAVPRGSVSSSGTTNSSRKVVSFVSGCSTATITGPGTPPPPAPPPLSTSRARRAHETLVPAGLITPAGPPPERALPAAPLRSPPQSPGPPVSPVSPLSPASHSAKAFRSVSPIPSAGEIGVAIGMGQDGAGTEPSEPARVRARGNRGTQDSGWGVWMGGPGDAGGVVRQARTEDQSQSADGRRTDQVGVDIVLRELETAKTSGGC